MFELWGVPGGEPLVRVLYNKEELPLDGHPPGVGAALKAESSLARLTASVVPSAVFVLPSLHASGPFHIQPAHRRDSGFVHVRSSPLSIPVCAPFAVRL